jgi:MFS family permease
VTPSRPTRHRRPPPGRHRARGRLRTALTPSGRLWRHPDFLKLWAGQTTSLMGSRVTELALPLTGILVLDATAGQLGILNAAEFLPVLFTTLLAGVWADRHRRRPMLLTSHLVRALALAAIPALAIFGGLSMPLLYAVALTVGIFTAQFDVAYVAYLPTLVRREDLVEGNSKLQSSQSVAQVAGQGMSGVIVQLLTAPIAIVVNAATFLVASASVVAIRHREPAVPRPENGRRGVFGEIGEGLRLALGSPVLRPLMLQSAWYNMLNDVILVVMPVYAVRGLHLPPATLGLVIASGSIGAFAGATLAGRLARRVGAGRAMALGMAGACTGYLVLPLASGPRPAVLAALVGGYIVYGCGLAVFNVHSVSIRQALVPAGMMGRIAASYRMVSGAAIPLGGLLGGLSADVFGMRTTLLGACAGLLASAAVFACSRGARVRDIDALSERDLYGRRRRRAVTARPAATDLPATVDVPDAA